MDKLSVVVEGNIGSGKSSYLEYCTNNFTETVSVVQEPLDKWQNLDGHNLLDLFYKDQARNAMCIETYVFRTLVDTHMETVQAPIKLIERSINSAYYCFTHLLKASGVLTGPEFAVLTDSFKFIKSNFPIKVDAIIYLRTTPAVAYERVIKRSREEEVGGITPEYLTDLHNAYEDWLVKNKFKDTTPVVYVDANCNMQCMREKYVRLHNILQQARKQNHLESVSI